MKKYQNLILKCKFNKFEFLVFMKIISYATIYTLINDKQIDIVKSFDF